MTSYQEYQGIKVVYHLHCQTGWSTVCANDKNILVGQIKMTLPFTVQPKFPEFFFLWEMVNTPSLLDIVENQGRVA